METLPYPTGPTTIEITAIDFERKEFTVSRIAEPGPTYRLKPGLLLQMKLLG